MPAPSPVENANFRAVFIAGAIVTDVFLFLAGRGASGIQQGALRSFPAVNISLLSLDLVFTLGVIRRAPRAAWPLTALGAVLEVLTSVVWIQFTGIVSSYFVFFPLVLVLLYRLGAGYGLGLCALAAAVSFPVVAFALERAGVLAHAPLLVDGSTALDARSPLAVVILASSDVTSVFAFAVANLLSWLLYEKDAAIRAVRDQLRQALAQGRQGELVGQSIANRYRLTDFLGRGGMGDVYKASRDGRNVALKILHPHMGADPRAVERFRREVEAARRLVGARVPEIFDSGTTDEGLHFFAMEWLPGEDLASLLRRRGRLPVAEVLVIADQLGEVLGVAHAAGIIHRDVKPQNVFLVESPDGSPVVHLLDFGIAAFHEREGEAHLTAASSVLGTPGFLAPEQITPGIRAVGPQTDVFAMGAVLYHLLTGRPAFPISDNRSAMFAALHATPRPPSTLVTGLPDDVDVVFSMALAKRAQERYPSAKAFAAALRLATTTGLTESMRSRAYALAETVAESSPTRTQRLDERH